MDFATILGAVIGFGLILGAMIMGGGLGAFVDFPSMLIVIGGTIAATMVMFPFATVFCTIKVGLKTILFKCPKAIDIIEQIVQLADVGRREGLLSLEKAPVDDAFLQKGVRLVADGSTPQLVRAVLETEIDSMKKRHTRGQGVFKAMGAASPAFGMIGTLVGLVQMLQALEDPAAIGPSMAVALLTTMYGAILANVLFLPLAKKLEERSNEESQYMDIVLEGVMAIQNGENPRIVKERLLSFIAPKQRPAES